MSDVATLVDAVVRERAERERHRLAYAYHLDWLIAAMRMPEEWRELHAGEIREAAMLCRRERSLATGVTEAVADATWGTVTSLAAGIAGGLR